MANAALQKPMQPSAELAAVIGLGPHTRAEATSKLWSYIKDNRCQNPENKREIVADAELKPVFGGAARGQEKFSDHGYGLRPRDKVQR